MANLNTASSLVKVTAWGDSILNEESPAHFRIRTVFIELRQKMWVWYIYTVEVEPRFLLGQPNNFNASRVTQSDPERMSRETILTNSPEPEDDDPTLRPSRMADMVGQRVVIDRLQVAIEAAKERQEVLGHILFDGPPGLGKTTFAHCIPAELGVAVEFLSGPSLKAPKDLVPSLTNLQKNQVLFIDEIHRVPKSVEEYMYTAMEDFRIDMILGCLLYTSPSPRD